MWLKLCIIVLKDMAFFSLIFNKSTYSYIFESELSLKFASQDKGLESKFLWGKFNPQMPGASVQLLSDLKTWENINSSLIFPPMMYFRLICFHVSSQALSTATYINNTLLIHCLLAVWIVSPCLFKQRNSCLHHLPLSPLPFSPPPLTLSSFPSLLFIHSPLYIHFKELSVT